ncbi:uncharacterized protein RAG0_15978 [Rhynchosporium agropyri]|uniref:Tc1-like transposase DDE domain-containing protein n=1 Tax=Rhynchosporium agropyri TaxID=914238 RepID=A0A1E1LN98_9HELO|nr:uncharacterized protein RAG0_15978 [Rhynchosporium agropyri]
MFWAAFGYGIRTQLIPMEGDPLAPKGGVTARVYQTVLDQYLLPILGFGSMFMQDNAPIYTVYIIRDWFATRGIDVMNWPPYSPDLNPIENLWALLKAEIYILYPELVGAPNTVETLDLLIRCTIDTWERLGDVSLNRLIDTMVHRVEAVIKAEGCHIDPNILSSGTRRLTPHSVNTERMANTDTLRDEVVKISAQLEKATGERDSLETRLRGIEDYLPSLVSWAVETTQALDRLKVFHKIKKSNKRSIKAG